MVCRARMVSRKPGAKPWDRYFVALVGVFTVGELVVPGFDHRWMWTPPQPVWKHLLGLALVVLGTLGLIWAMKTNRFFSAFIRIQQDRGHQVVDAGPYRLVRHPGYAFWSLRTLGVFFYLDRIGHLSWPVCSCRCSLSGRCWRIGFSRRSYQNTRSMRNEWYGNL